jgi:thioredoxin 1
MKPIATVDPGELAPLSLGPTPLLIDFAADWCGPCRRMDPVLAELADEFAGQLQIVRIDTDLDGASDAVDLYGADGLPALVFVRNGAITGRLIGWHEPERLRQEIAMLLDVEAGIAPQRTGLAVGRTPARSTFERAARELRFPDESVGMLRITAAGEVSRQPAAGTVTVPAGATVGLGVAPNDDARIDLRFLLDLPPDGIDDLHISGRVHDGDLRPLASRRRMRSLLIASEDFTGAGLRSLAGATELETLLLSCPALDDGFRSLPVLPALRMLSVQGAEQLGDLGIAPVARLTGLTSLDLCAHRVTDAGLADVLASLPDLAGLTLCIPDVTDASLGAIGALNRLRSLALETPFAGSGTLQAAATLADLRSMALYNCTKIATADLAPFTGLSKLRVKIDDAEPSEVEILQLRTALPDCEINGSWYAAEAVCQRLAALTAAR